MPRFDWEGWDDNQPIPEWYKQQENTMAKMVTGIRIDSITITREHDEAGSGVKMTGKYSIMGEEGKVFAKQEFNDYSSAIKFDVSSEVAAAVRMLADQLKKEIESITGIA